MENKATTSKNSDMFNNHSCIPGLVIKLLIPVLKSMPSSLEKILDKIFPEW